jgi:HEAT repeat protein
LQDRSAVARASDILTDGLRGEDVNRCLWACLLLTEGVAPAQAKPRLRRLMDHPDERVRVCAAAALSTIDAGSAKLIQTLRRALRDERPGIVLVAARVFARLGVHSAEPVEELAGALASESDDCVYPILLALAELGPQAHVALGVVADCMNDRKRAATLRGRAARTLGCITRGSDEGTAALMRALSSDSWQVVAGAVEGLTEGGRVTPQVVERIEELLLSEHEEVEIAAALALGRFGPSAATSVPALLRRLHGKLSPELGTALARALGDIGEAAAPALIDIIRRHDMQAIPIASAAFVHMGSKGAKALAEALRTETDEWVRAVLVALVRELGGEAGEAVPVLASILAEAEDEELAAMVLAAIDATGQAAMQAVPALVACACEGSDELAFAARRVLRNLGPEATGAVEATLAELPPGERNRLDDLRPQADELPDRLFAKFDGVSDKLLWNFVYVADILIEHGPVGLKRMAEMLPERKKQGKVPADFKGQSRMLGIRIGKLEQRLCFRFHDGIPGRAGELTPEARAVLVEVKAYLRAKAERRRRVNRID